MGAAMNLRHILFGIIMLSQLGFAQYKFDSPTFPTMPHDNFHNFDGETEPEGYECLLTLTDNSIVNTISKIHGNKYEYLDISDTSAYSFSQLDAKETKNIECNGITGLTRGDFWHFEMVYGHITLYQDNPAEGDITLLKIGDQYYENWQDQLLETLKSNPTAFDNYKKAQSQHKIGLVTTITGLGLFAYGIVKSIQPGGFHLAVPIGVGLSWVGWIITPSEETRYVKPIEQFNYEYTP